MDLFILNIIKGIFNKELKHVEEIVGKGVVNRVFKCEVGEFKYILRLQNTADALTNYTKEEWAMNLALSHNINTAQPIALGVRDNFSFSIQTFIEGFNAEEYEDQVFVWRELGKIAKKIHTIQIEGFGENPKFEKNPNGHASWQDVVYWFEDRLSCDNLFLKFDIFTQDELEKLKDLIPVLLNWRITPVLCHGNLTPRNAILDKNNCLFVYDWGTSCGFPKEREFAEFVAWDVSEKHQEAFFEGYGYSKEEYKKNKKSIYILAIMRLIDAARWGIEHKSDWRKEDFVLHAIKRVKELLSNI